MLESKAFDDVNSDLANDNAFGDFVQVELSFARFELTFIESLRIKQVPKRAASSKLNSDADFSKLVN